MKESIFFNRKQLGIIRWYMLLYRVLFDYGVRVFSLLFSLIFLFLLTNSQVFSFTKEVDMSEFVAIENTINKDQKKYEGNVAMLSGIELIYLGGEVETKDSTLKSQNNILKLGSLILPRLTVGAMEDLEKYATLFSGNVYSDQDFSRFFQTLFVKPIQMLQTSDFAYQKYKLSIPIWEYFGLECLNTYSSASFVCQKRLNNFLENFYLIEFSTAETMDSMSVGVGEYSEFASMISFSEQLESVFSKIQYNRSKRMLFCDSMLKFVKYGGVVDSKISQMMYSCDINTYVEYQKMRDASEVNFGFYGVANEVIYANNDLNLYKLFSLQQMLYKQMLALTEVGSYVDAYVTFLKNLLTQESQKGSQILNSFSRNFTSWFNTTILIPYLRSDSAKISMKEKNTLIADLLLIENGDKNSLFNGLKTEFIEDENEHSDTIEDLQIDIETLFKGNMPAQFIATSFKSDSDVLIVEGEDQITKIKLSATVRFDGARLYVESLKITQNKALEEFVNSLLKTDKYTFGNMLTLLKENLEIGQQTQQLTLDLCTLAEQKFGEELVSCTVSLMKIEKNKSDSSSGVIYQFSLVDEVLKGVKVSDKSLASAIAQELDLSRVNKDTTLSMIEKIVAYKLQSQGSGFGAKEQILVNDSFVKYFKQKPNKIEIVGNVVKVYFTVKDINFIGHFDVATNRLSPIALDFGGARREVIVQKLEFTLTPQVEEDLNSFLLDPIAYLTKLNSRLVEKYFEDGKLITNWEKKTE